jgi:hypothetical protein
LMAPHGVVPFGIEVDKHEFRIEISHEELRRCI